MDLQLRRLEEVVDHGPSHLSTRMHNRDFVLDLNTREARYPTALEASGLAMHVSDARGHADAAHRPILASERDTPSVDVFKNGTEPAESAPQALVLTVDEVLILCIEPQQLHERIQSLGPLGSQTFRLEVQRIPGVPHDHGRHYLWRPLPIGVSTRRSSIKDHLSTAVQEPDGLGESGCRQHREPKGITQRAPLVISYCPPVTERSGRIQNATARTVERGESPEMT
ncbi:hypothetical protein ACFYOR_34205 [Streptomyces griseofuscus]|uniref:hypothetical protein n=1 Tax=Streptomyces TaxID=1883 RepID=UPI0018F0A03C|nr:hypothetical protein [Streptomyces sp. CRPSP2-6A1]MBJ7002418.1 hypothetical protein [Streptomyces sp. CRPSP2-6A1]